MIGKDGKNKEVEDFTFSQEIKRSGTHVKVGFFVDSYYISKNGILYIFCEQTRQKLDWLTNFFFYLVKVEISKGNFAKYHAGFALSAIEMIKSFDRLLKTHKDVKVYGYSKGAGWGSIFCDIIQGWYKINLLQPVFFGSPNSVMQNKKVKELRSNYIYYKQGNDVVTFLPPWLKKYGQTVKLKGRGNPFKSHDYFHLDKKV